MDERIEKLIKETNSKGITMEVLGTNEIAEGTLETIESVLREASKKAIESGLSVFVTLEHDNVEDMFVVNKYQTTYIGSREKETDESYK